MKQLTNLIKVYLRQLSARTKKALLTKDTTTQRWTAVKEINGKAKQSNKLNFPRKLKIDNKIRTGEEEIANNLTNILQILVHHWQKISLIHQCRLKFFEKSQYCLNQSVFINKRIERCNFYLKTNKSPGADEINFNVIKHCFGKLCRPLILSARKLSMGGLLDFNLSDVTKYWPVFLDDLQFKIFTLIFLQVAGKPLNFCIFSKDRHFMLGSCRNLSLGVF